MSMEVDFMHPRRLEDVEFVQAAIKNFDKSVRKMMVLMKELGIMLEDVSRAFDAFVSISFVDPAVKSYVHGFTREVMFMKEGVSFQSYNSRVYEDVVKPVKTLKAELLATKRAAEERKKAYEQYTMAKKKVDKTEKQHAQKSKALEESVTYIQQKRVRDRKLEVFQKKGIEFQNFFLELMHSVEVITTTTLKRYLGLNAGFLSSVISAITRTDHEVHEVINLYQKQLDADQQLRCVYSSSKSQASLSTWPPTNHNSSFITASHDTDLVEKSPREAKINSALYPPRTMMHKQPMTSSRSLSHIPTALPCPAAQDRLLASEPTFNSTY